MTQAEKRYYPPRPIDRDSFADTIPVEGEDGDEFSYDLSPVSRALLEDYQRQLDDVLDLSTPVLADHFGDRRPGDWMVEHLLSD